MLKSNPQSRSGFPHLSAFAAHLIKEKQWLSLTDGAEPFLSQLSPDITSQLTQQLMEGLVNDEDPNSIPAFLKQPSLTVEEMVIFFYGLRRWMNRQLPSFSKDTLTQLNILKEADEYTTRACLMAIGNYMQVQQELLNKLTNVLSEGYPPAD